VASHSVLGSHGDELMSHREQLFQHIFTCLECAICLSTLQEPRALPCTHTFCTACLEGFWRASHPMDGELHSCPTCRQPFLVPEGGIRHLPRNYLVGQVLEALLRPDQPVCQQGPRDVADHCPFVPSSIFPENPSSQEALFQRGRPLRARYLDVVSFRYHTRPPLRGSVNMTSSWNRLDLRSRYVDVLAHMQAQSGGLQFRQAGEATRERIHTPQAHTPLREALIAQEAPSFTHLPPHLRPVRHRYRDVVSEAYNRNAAHSNLTSQTSQLALSQTEAWSRTEFHPDQLLV